MGEFKHLVVAKFKEGVNVDDIVDQVKKLVSDIDSVKSFEWYLSLFRSTISVERCYVISSHNFNQFFIFI